jgi:hypothetical protein
MFKRVSYFKKAMPDDQEKFMISSGTTITDLFSDLPMVLAIEQPISLAPDVAAKIRASRETATGIIPTVLGDIHDNLFYEVSIKNIETIH